VLGLSPVRLLIIALVALIVLGPKELPKYARQAGAAWKTLRGLQEKVESELREAVPDLPRTADIARYARSPISLLNQLADRATAEERAKAPPDHDAEPEADADADPVVEGYTPPMGDETEVRDPGRPQLSWGDPSLN
jgi:Sec-independent protein translocase protein TatA